MKKFTLFMPFIFFVALITPGCQHDGGPVTFDCKVDSVTWKNNVKFTVQQKCQGCHTSNTILPTLDTYAQVMVIVDDGRLMNVIKHNPGYMAMPYNSDKLEPCVIDNIQSWVDAGAPEE